MKASAVTDYRGLERRALAGAHGIQIGPVATTLLGQKIAMPVALAPLTTLCQLDNR